ncbi:cyclin-like protein [Bisporella sp. PMI_857]|nr:cyclin-like protein [Bisporella sp. PMI_857]
MDAKPQRPLRIARLPGDENIVPPEPKQTLHARHKSTGALSKATGTLSNMLHVGGLKAAAKRTAFGDVSNISKNVSQTRDTSAANGGDHPSDYVKPLNIPEKSMGFARPAQRPLNVTGGTGIQITNTQITTTEPASKSVASKAPLSQIQPIPVAAKRTVSKKCTTIYIDHGEDESLPQVLPERSEPAIAPVHQSLQARKSQGQLKAQGPTETESKVIDAQVQQNVTHVDFETSDAVVEPVDSNEGYPKLVSQVQDAALPEISEATQDAVERLHRHLPSLPALPAPPAASEVEEYWDEEEEDEVDDEQGYMTAHSYRSRGDNTTGGATTVLFPKVTNKSKKELAEAKEAVESSRTTEDIEDELYDTSMVAEYGDEIFGYMRELEMKMLPNPHYMENQAEIQWSMRSVLMDWLIQVHHRFTLLPETLFLTVNYVDRFLSCKVVSLGKLQLVGATAIFVAAKYEEINCPSVSEIVFMVDGGYTVDEILKAERFMLSMLQFELGYPGPMSFLRRISKADEYDLDTRTLAKYFLEVAIMDERFVGSPASYIAAGSHCLARMLLKKDQGEWTPAHVHYSGYTWTQLRPLVALMLECCENPQKHHSAVYEKFSDRRYKRGSLFVQTELERGFVLPPLPSSRPSLPIDDLSTHVTYEARESFTRMVQLKG